MFNSEVGFDKAGPKDCPDVPNIKSRDRRFDRRFHFFNQADLNCTNHGENIPAVLYDLYDLMQKLVKFYVSIFLAVSAGIFDPA